MSSTQGDTLWPQWYIGTIGAMSELAGKKLAQWRRETIRHLLDMEKVAKQVRDELEADNTLRSADPAGIDTLIYHTMSLTTLSDRITGLEEAGF